MSDVELSTEARRLIESARPAHEPSGIERARVRRSLEWKLAAGVMLTVTQAAPFLSAAVKVGLAVVATGAVVGTGAYFGARAVKEHTSRVVDKKVTMGAPALTPTAGQVVPQSPPPEEHQATEAIAPPPVQTASPKRRESRPAPTSTATAAAMPDLGAEMALLQTANAALGRGQVQQALAALASYDRQFQAGQLAEERSALGVLALCSAGRDDEAIRAHKRFLQRWPKSPLEARMINSCAVAKPRPE
jgi:hypothetical protein